MKSSLCEDHVLELFCFVLNNYPWSQGRWENKRKVRYVHVFGNRVVSFLVGSAAETRWLILCLFVVICDTQQNNNKADLCSFFFWSTFPKTWVWQLTIRWPCNWWSAWMFVSSPVGVCAENGTITEAVLGLCTLTNISKKILSLT